MKRFYVDKMSTKFWVENIIELVSINKGVFPSSAHKLPDNLNAISRLALLGCLMLAMLSPLTALVVFCIIMLLIMAMYYAVGSSEKYNGKLLMGPPNPKTLIPVPMELKIKSHDFSSWNKLDPCEICGNYICTCTTKPIEPKPIEPKGHLQVRQQYIDAFNASTLISRNNFQESLMSKRNRDYWQLSAAPIQ